MMFAGYSIWLWIGFHAGVLLILALDLGILNRKAHIVQPKEALIWSVIWISLSLLFCEGVYFFIGQKQGLEFLTGYLIEESLSIDNLFVFILVFRYFSVPAEYHHRVLFWGILGALVMRATMITAGTVMITKFHWIIYVFGAFLVYTGFKMLFGGETEIQPGKNPILKLIRRFLPMTPDYRGQSFVVREQRLRKVTPLFAVLMVVESTDVIFAVDSIPAIFAVTRDPFIVYTSNICAILGLRSLFFLLESVISRLCYLKHGLAIVLGFIGVKMLIEYYVHIPIGWSLSVVAGILAVATVASLCVKDSSKSNLK